MVLVVLLTAAFTLAVDFSILNVALPVIGADVGFSLTGLQWIATSFAVCAAGFTLLFGRVADLAGRRRLFLYGIALLGASSLAGGLADSPAVLLGARVAQGLATAAVTPAALALMTVSFPEGPRRERALGLNGALMAAGFTTGAILGGVLTDLASWRWAFFVNVIVAVLVLAVAPVVLAESRPAERPRLDVPGAVLVTAGLVVLAFGTLWSTLLGGLLLVAFGLVERRAAEPLALLPMLRRRTVAWGNLAGMLAFATETSLVFLLTLDLQQVRGFTALETGLSFAVLGVGTVLGGILGPRVIAYLQSPPKAVVLGLTAQAAATLVLVFPVPLPVLLTATFAGGVANLVAIVGFMVTATAGLPDGEQGLAAGLATMSQQIGITLGIPAMSAVVAGTVPALGIGTALHVAVAVNAALCVLGALAVRVFLPAARPAVAV
ncbi:MFS transporter [Actinoplanes sp. L3-i22]|uniref:MFS transporter n=1 Tax=Actinoplanes sp. L3-i22 TaxID=2836373 RepID=UPI001C78419F|nr:MFS transporter [Actinoplanes sp. L3-i22]BCY10649.1 MFS transporter [Actinoplanes sp. L3-i22]